MATGPHLSIITLNVSGLNVPNKRQRLADGYKNKTPIYAVYKKPTSKQESSKQDKPKVKHPKTHINQINKYQRTKIKSHKGEPTNNTQRDSHKDNSLFIISIETLQARREWQDILRVMKENNLQPRLL